MFRTANIIFPFVLLPNELEFVYYSYESELVFDFDVVDLTLLGKLKLERQRVQII